MGDDTVDESEAMTCEWSTLCEETFDELTFTLVVFDDVVLDAAFALQYVVRISSPM
jgi:hypothetical protein